ncbi:hypothetical protein NHH73_28965 [Oxalobacteraceae bacterium OTU3CINTB1]|nr:hypothetical protein NHH73_28965 [Oxalobacteraceae bacterium OTU3CINTB1]
MTTPKTRTKSSDRRQVFPKAELLRDNGVRSTPTQQDKFSAVVKSVAKRYGVKVASVAAPAKNPYAMTANQAAEIAIKAGIVTRDGKLTPRFR